MNHTDEPVSQGPFRIHVVAELTGVPEPTLRAWERRYGIPSPERTASGYRLYASREVEQVRQMRRLCESGMAAAEAARAVKGGSGLVGADEKAPSTVDGDAHAASVEAILAAVDRFDDDGLDRELRRLFFLGSATTLLDRVIAPLLVAIGDRWHAGELSIAQEHFASQRIGTFLRDLVALTPGVDGDTRAVLACFADEDHELGLLGTALRFSSWGLRPVFLGARTPPGAVANAVESVAPRLVALSITVAPEKARARELVDGYAQACRGVPWIVGGASAPAIGDLVRARGGVVDDGDAAKLRWLARQTMDGGVAPAAPRNTKEKRR